MPLLRVVCDFVVSISITGAGKAALGVTSYTSSVVGVALRAKGGLLTSSPPGTRSSIFAYLIILYLIAFNKGNGNTSTVAACTTSIPVLTRTAWVAAVLIVLTVLNYSCVGRIILPSRVVGLAG